MIVGVNRHQAEQEQPISILKIDAALEQKQIDRVQSVRSRRRPEVVGAAARRDPRRSRARRRNLMPLFVDSARDDVTMGEMCDALRTVWGTWRETPVF